MREYLSNNLMWKNLLYIIISAILIYYSIVYLSLKHAAKKEAEEKGKKKKQQDAPVDNQKISILTAKFNGKSAAVAFLIPIIVQTIIIGAGAGTSTTSQVKESPFFSPEPTSSINLHVGDIVYFGSYSVEENSSKETWPKIEWIVIDVDGDKAKLLSKKGLRYMPYEESMQATIWRNSSIRKWLNEEFYPDALNSASFILYEETYTFSRSFPKNQYKSNDKVYLLSTYEVEQLLSPEDRICEPTNDSISSFNGQEIHMDGDAWYLREEGKSYSFVATVDRDGTFTDGGSTNNGGGILVRPCITISISRGIDYIDIKKLEATTP